MGRGRFSWPSGATYEGEFKSGYMDGTESSLSANLEWDPKAVYNELADCKICPGERVSILPSQKKLAIWRSVGRSAPATALDLKASTFDPKEKIWTRFPPEGSKYTPPHQSCEFKWKDYFPVVFRYMIKTMKKSEVKVLLRMLSAYYNHVRSFENILVIKYYGLHRVKLTGATQKRRFDLKGSSLGRITEKPKSEIDDTTILKDLI
ncbi:hypothetical protein CRYUN_Cryun05aG0083800 [Craigia yunnanensis]